MPGPAESGAHPWRWRKESQSRAAAERYDYSWPRTAPPPPSLVALPSPEAREEGVGGKKEEEEEEGVGGKKRVVVVMVVMEEELLAVSHITVRLSPTASRVRSLRQSKYEVLRQHTPLLIYVSCYLRFSSPSALWSCPSPSPYPPP
jgi:hypothetical protein